jgi:hypothetical protein
MADLPANVTFGPNLDMFKVDQADDAITSVQAFQNGKRELIIELWGKTTVIAPAGARDEGREFQQNTVIEFDDEGGFTWRVTRWVFEQSHDVEQATTFQVYGTEDEVPKYRRY